MASDADPRETARFHADRRHPLFRRFLRDSGRGGAICGLRPRPLRARRRARLGLEPRPVGAVVWTLVERLIHRFAYHGAPILAARREAHHREPNAFIGAPSFLSSGLAIAIRHPPLTGLGPPFAGGMLIGDAATLFVHHATYHFVIEPGDWLYRARAPRMARHDRDDANFGVSVGWRDRVFPTEGARGSRTARA